MTFATGFIVNTSRHLPKLAEELIRFTRRLEAEEAAQRPNKQKSSGQLGCPLVFLRL